ncbi:MAG: hypothetical protein EPO13_04935 [Actinomycetota bacterium]|nr:MAG: hypothetical protein EPO13_04935 [Actinomycetota bacterium]
MTGPATTGRDALGVPGPTQPSSAGVRLLARVIFAVTGLISAVSLVVDGVQTARLYGAGRPLQDYFSYFTVQSNIIVVVCCVVLVADPARDGRIWRVIRLDSLLCIAVTGLVYVTVLRGDSHPQGSFYWTNIGLHYVTPTLVVVGWLLVGPRPRISWLTIPWALIYPLLWLAYTLIRGAQLQWYPYPFIDVTAHGYGQVAVNCLAVTVLFVVLGLVLRLLDRALPAVP